MYLITIIEILIGSSIYFIVKFKEIYMIELLLTAICIGGSYVILAPTFVKIFSLSIGPELYGITGISIGVANIMGPVFIEFFSADNISFLTLFFIGVGSCIVKIIDLFFFDENIRLYQINKDGVQMNIINDSFSINDSEINYL